jgi:hypothetical protein
MPLFCSQLGRDTSWRRLSYSSDLDSATTYLVISAPSPTAPSIDVLREIPFTPPEGYEWRGNYYAAALPAGAGPYEFVRLSDASYTNPRVAIDAATAWCEADGNGATPTIIQCSQMGAADNGALRDVPRPMKERIDEANSLATATRGDVTLGNSCRTCGFFGHNSRTCTSAVDIDKVGIEVEGRWKESRWNEVQSTRARLEANGCSDGSLRHKSGFNSYEFQTKPGTLASALRQLVDLYPDDTGRDCGMHVHVSFKCETHFTQLTTPEFFAYFRSRWQQWGEKMQLDPQSLFFERLNGGNDYCRPNVAHSNHYSADHYSADRYYQLNFSAYGEHRTVECRLLPMFRSVELGAAAVTELLQIYKDWLSVDCTVALPEVVFNDVDPAYGKTIAMTEMGDFDLTLVDSHTTDAVEVETLAPPAPGMRRIATSAATIQAFNDFLLAA